MRLQSIRTPALSGFQTRISCKYQKGRGNWRDYRTTGKPCRFLKTRYYPDFHRAHDFSYMIDTSRRCTIMPEKTGKICSNPKNSVYNSLSRFFREIPSDPTWTKRISYRIQGKDQLLVPGFFFVSPVIPKIRKICNNRRESRMSLVDQVDNESSENAWRGPGCEYSFSSPGDLLCLFPE